MAYQSFEDLDVWKRSCQLAVRTYEIMRPCKDYGLKDQMQRSAVSIASNIAEGCERGGKDFDRFLRIALGSSAELRTQTYIAYKIDALSESHFSEILNDVMRISKMLHGLRKSLSANAN